MAKKILLAGESWHSTTTHVKGFDPFFSSEFETGHQFLQAALEECGCDVVYMPNHLAATCFPFRLEELKEYACIILSDIGSNTLLLPPDTFRLGKRTPNRCNLLRDYVLEGGAVLMVGGYLTFTGIDGKGRWGSTSVQEILPVKLSPYDDRAEHPEGVLPEVVDASHPVLAEIGEDWPFFLGYNKSSALPGSEVPVTIEGDPLIAMIKRGKGRCAVFASDCAPHWAPAEFTGWRHFATFWNNMIIWLTNP